MMPLPHNMHLNRKRPHMENTSEGRNGRGGRSKSKRSRSNKRGNNKYNNNNNNSYYNNNHRDRDRRKWRGGGRSYSRDYSKSYSSYSSDSESFSSSSSTSTSRNMDEKRNYPIFTSEYARKFGGGNLPFLRLSRIETQQQQQHHLPLLRQGNYIQSSQIQTNNWQQNQVEIQQLILYNEYIFERELGKGTYSKVVLCKSLRNGDYYALKIFRNEQNYRDACWDEMGVFKALCNPVGYNQQNNNNNNNNNNVYSGSSEYQGRMGRFNVPIAHIQHPFHHAIVLPVLGSSLLDVLRDIRHASEKICNNNVNDLLSKSQDNKLIKNNNYNNNMYSKNLNRDLIEIKYRGISIDMLRTILFQILIFLKHAHSRGIVHTDLKPENVLFESTYTLPMRLNIMKRRYNYHSSQTAETCTQTTTCESSDLEGNNNNNNNNINYSGINGCGTQSTNNSSNAFFSCCSPVQSSVDINETLVDVSLPALNSIRVIDVGAAEFISKCRHVSPLDGTTRVFFHRIQTKHYRSIEVLLGLGWAAPTDMWSLGCMIPELITGECVFMPRDDIEHLALIQHILGGFDILEVGGKSNIVHRVFSRGRNFKEFFNPQTMQLKWSPASYLSSSSSSSTMNYHNNSSYSSKRREDATQLEDFKYIISRPTLQEILEPFPQLYDLCRRMLDYDPLRRITAAEALQHPFFTCANS